MVRQRDLTPENKTWLADWLDTVSPDLDVVFYVSDGTDAPDTWEPHPHLAVRQDVPLRDGVRAMIWPVHVEGWADPADVGWQGVADLMAQGRRI
jgi:hypothetical protein